MATVDRIQPASTTYRPWSPSTSGFSDADDSTDEYIGRHRRPESRRASFLRMFYTGKHRRL